MNEQNQVAVSFPTAQEISTLKDLGSMAVGSGFLPSSIRTKEQAVIIMLKGRELGIPPMQAFSSIAVVNGKPTISAELMLALIYQKVPGSIVDFTETTASSCVISAARPKGKPTVFSFTMEDAKRAGLAGKGPWASYPAAMLRARCISAMARAMFPDALMGASYTPEELGAEVSADGEVIAVPQAPAPAVVVKPVIQEAEIVEAEEAPVDDKPTTQDLARLFQVVSKKHRWTQEQLRSYMAANFGVNDSRQLTRTQYDQLVSVVSGSSHATAMKELEAMAGDEAL